jgi:hypothetical protein
VLDVDDVVRHALPVQLLHEAVAVAAPLGAVDRQAGHGGLPEARGRTPGQQAAAPSPSPRRSPWRLPG